MNFHSFLKALLWNSETPENNQDMADVPGSRSSDKQITKQANQEASNVSCGLLTPNIASGLTQFSWSVLICFVQVCGHTCSYDRKEARLMWIYPATGT